MNEQKMSYEVLEGAVRIEGEAELVFRPRSVSAWSGTLVMGTLPWRQGGWRGWLRRFFAADRFVVRRGQLAGRLWLAAREAPVVTALPSPTGDERLQVLSNCLLCADGGCRESGFRLFTVPGSLREALAVTVFRGWGRGVPVVVCTESPLNAAVVGEGEELHVKPSALVAWSGCGKPRAFCAKLRLRDMVIPRPPETLTLDFSGPGVVYFQGVAPAEKSRRKPR